MKLSAGGCVTKSAFLSGLGMMGRRHLKGLVGRDIQVTAFDPSEASRDQACGELAAAGLDAGLLGFCDSAPTGSFDIAIFSEVATYRHDNVSNFLENASAERYLLEKPLSADPVEVAAFAGLFAKHGVPDRAISVNLLRRSWDYVRRLKALCETSDNVQMTVNGGAFGFGCNGIHFIDLFLFLTGVPKADVVFSRLDEARVPSGRGPAIVDFGGRFLLENQKGSFFCSGSATSSAGISFSLRGQHFLAWVDETDLSWKLMVRKPGSQAPVYRCGFEYEIEAQEVAKVDGMDVSTGKWAKGELDLPSLNDVLPAHDLLHRILAEGGAEPPYGYT